MEITDRGLFLVAVALYGASLVYSVFLWRRGFRQDDRVNYCLLLAAFLFHFLAMWKRGVSFQRCPVHNLYEASLFIGWSIMLALLVLGLMPRLRFLGVFASPILFGLGVFGLMPMLDQVHSEPLAAKGTALSLHAALTLLAYGAFGLGAVAGAMFLVQEKDLKQHKARAVLSLLPPIQRLEAVVKWQILAGLALLSAGLLVGILWVPAPSGYSIRGDFKVLWSVFVWLMYAALLGLHLGFAQRGRRFAWGAVSGFLFILLTFWGANLASPLHSP